MLLHLASPVKVFSLKEEVTDIVIVPHEKLFLPEGYEDVSGTGTFDENFVEGGIDIQLLPRSRRPRGEVQTEEDTFPVAQPELERARGEVRIKRDLEIPDKIILPGKISTPSKSKSSSYFKLRIPVESEMNLSPFKGREWGVPGEFDEEEKKKAEKLSKSLYPRFPESGSGRGSSYYKADSSRGITRRARVTFKVRDYDITPWASVVVNRIQKNWDIPRLEDSTMKGSVGISIIVKRNGELSSVEIISSSNESFLDKAALEAVNISSPLPRLPVDFPHKNLEVFLVFQYNE